MNAPYPCETISHKPLSHPDYIVRGFISSFRPNPHRELNSRSSPSSPVDVAETALILSYLELCGLTISIISTVIISNYHMLDCLSRFQ